MVAPHFNIGILFLKQGNRKLALDQYEILKSIDAGLARSLFGEIYPENIDDVTAPK